MDAHEIPFELDDFNYQQMYMEAANPGCQANDNKGSKMSSNILILGESGTGKSTSVRNLDPKETFIINVLGKALPFPKAKNKYTLASKENPQGNLFQTDNAGLLLKCLKTINDKRPDIKHIVIDDFGYMLSNAFMRRAFEKGYNKFSELAKDVFDVITYFGSLRDDLFVFVMMHVDIDANERYKPKTVGKMVDQYICIEGHFTYVLTSIVKDGEYKFITNNDGQHMAKTPLGLFEESLIDNDLTLVTQAIKDY